MVRAQRKWCKLASNLLMSQLLSWSSRCQKREDHCRGLNLVKRGLTQDHDLASLSLPFLDYARVRPRCACSLNRLGIVHADLASTW
jgi:hypothetical protein